MFCPHVLTRQTVLLENKRIVQRLILSELGDRFESRYWDAINLGAVPTWNIAPSRRTRVGGSQFIRQWAKEWLARARRDTCVRFCTTVPSLLRTGVWQSFNCQVANYTSDKFHSADNRIHYVQAKALGQTSQVGCVTLKDLITPYVLFFPPLSLQIWA